MVLVNVNGVELYYEQVGAGERIVLTHGAWTDGRGWQDVTERLADRFELVAWDRRGHSRSQDGIGRGSYLEELKAYNLGAQIGTTSLDYIEQIIEPDTPPAVYDTNSDAKSALEAGQIDAIVFDLPTAYFITAVEIPEAAIVGALPASAEQADRFGMLMVNESALKPCVDRALEALENDGTLEALADEWLQQAADIPELTP